MRSAAAKTAVCHKVGSEVPACVRRRLEAAEDIHREPGGHHPGAGRRARRCCCQPDVVRQGHHLVHREHARRRGAARPGRRRRQGNRDLPAPRGRGPGLLLAERLEHRALDRAHIHKGNVDASGPVYVPLDHAELVRLVERVREGGVAEDRRATSSRAPSTYYVNVHNAEFASGAIRAQLQRPTNVSLLTGPRCSARTRSRTRVTPTAPEAARSRSTSTRSRLCYTLAGREHPASGHRRAHPPRRREHLGPGRDPVHPAGRGRHLRPAAWRSTVRCCARSSPTRAGSTRTSTRPSSRAARSALRSRPCRRPSVLETECRNPEARMPAAGGSARPARRPRIRGNARPRAASSGTRSRGALRRRTRSSARFLGRPLYEGRCFAAGEPGRMSYFAGPSGPRCRDGLPGSCRCPGTPVLPWTVLWPFPGAASSCVSAVRVAVDLTLAGNRLGDGDSRPGSSLAGR